MKEYNGNRIVMHPTQIVQSGKATNAIKPLLSSYVAKQSKCLMIAVMCELDVQQSPVINLHFVLAKN